MPFLRRILPAFGAVLVAAAVACSAGEGRGAADRNGTDRDAASPDTADREAGVPALDTAMTDSAARPVVVTLRRDSLGLPADAPADSVIAAMRRMADSLQRVAPFQVLAISPAVHALQVRATDGETGLGNARVLAARLREHPWVAAAEVEGIVRAPGRE